MSHVDDGQLNALLDGELAPHEVRAVEAHVASCAECRRRFEEARSFLNEAGALVESLAPGAAPLVAPRDPKFVVAAAAAAAMPEEPRRVSKTLKEVAVTLDGRTEKTPAIQPVFPHEVPAPRARPKRTVWDLEKLAWAASITLALGVGWLANQVYHMRQEQGVAALRAPDTSQPTGLQDSSGTGVRPAPPASTRRDRAAAKVADARASGAGVHHQTSGPAARGHAELGGARATNPAPRSEPRQRADQLADAAGPPPTAFDKPHLAIVKTPPRITAPGRDANVAARPAATPPAMAAPSPAPAGSTRGLAAQPAAPAPSAAGGVSGAALRRAEPDAPASGAGLSNRLDEATVTTPAREANTPGFRRITMEEAVRFLSGAIRQIDGLTPLRIEVAAGRLVPGADPARNVVRVTYTNQAGQIFRLDQQPMDRRSGTGANGLMPGDTLRSRDGGIGRARWTDGKFWLSLSGPVTIGEITAIVGRVR